MAEDETILPALTTEHLALQNAASATIAESNGRATLYLSALSSSLVAVGFASANPAVLSVFVATLFPVIFLMGVLTLVREVDTNVEAIAAAERIAAIRRYYAEVRPGASAYFPPTRLERLQRDGVRRTDLLFTMATMICFVNAALAGATVALVLSLVLRIAPPVALGAGIAAGVVALLIGFRYQVRRTLPIMSALGPSPHPHRI